MASLCKNRKMVYIYSGSGCQYIGQGCACWMVPGTLEVSKGNVLTIFDITEDKQPDWMVQEEGMLDLMVDVLEGEEQAEIYPFDLNCYDSTYRLLKDADGIAVIDTQYLAPLAASSRGCSITSAGPGAARRLLRSRRGLSSWRLSRPAMRRSSRMHFWTTCRTCAGSAGRWADKHQQQEEDAAQLRIDPETGEVEENEDV